MTGKIQNSGRDTLFQLCAFKDAYSLIYKKRWKFLYNRQEGYRQLYDLNNDLQEKHNIIFDNPAMDKKLTSILSAFLWNGFDTYNNPHEFKSFNFDPKK